MGTQLVAPNPPQIRCPVSWGVTDITAGPCLTNLDPLNPILRSIWVCGKSFMSNSKKPGYLGPGALLPFLLRLLALGLDLCFLLASWEPRGHRWGGLYCGDANWLVSWVVCSKLSSLGEFSRCKTPAPRTARKEAQRELFAAQGEWLLRSQERERAELHQFSLPFIVLGSVPYILCRQFAY